MVDWAKNMEIIWKKKQDATGAQQRKRSKNSNVDESAKYLDKSWHSGKQKSYEQMTYRDKLKCEACDGIHKTENYRWASKCPQNLQ